MYISIGKFVLHDRKKIFQFLRLSKLIEVQAKNATGNLEVDLSGGQGGVFWMFTTWETLQDMKQFAHSGQHLTGIQKAQELANEISLLTFESHKNTTRDQAIQELDTNPNTRFYKYT
jgi:heme-degrading monooxygenase HmoA